MINSNVTISVENDIVNFTIKKELSINNVSEVKEKLLKEINQNDEIKIILKKIDYNSNKEWVLYNRD